VVPLTFIDQLAVVPRSDEHILTGARGLRTLTLIAVLDRQRFLDDQLFAARVESQNVIGRYSSPMDIASRLCNQLRPVPVRPGSDRLTRLVPRHAFFAVERVRNRLRGDFRSAAVLSSGLDRNSGFGLPDNEGHGTNRDSLMRGLAA